ncbi:tetratricopeptide repeat protein [Ramlibacter sp. WS9]|uniref:tetratricopeptide repeat protein n=1 Tax=Ramlibacter sp. WS9 TaxID=1882741 RepID=UPI001305102E|nr:tetratricopeptide repeat protein [Ramlibacter sp. WS9]
MIAATFFGSIGMSGTFEQARDFFIEGVAHYQAGRLTDAERSFAASLALVPGRASTLTNLGAVRLKLGKVQEAADLLEEALKQEPDNAEALGHRATALAELGQHKDALNCADRALALNPALGPVWSLRGELLKDLGRYDEAATSFENAIAHGGDPQLHRYYLASLTGRDVPAKPPRQYVETLFDHYAEGFDEHLVQVLHYRAPQVLAEGLKRMKRRFTRALDLGCGTGLCGPLVKPMAGALVGVDLSATMVERAASLGVYDEVVQSDVVSYLQATPHRFDLMLAADVFIYVGALEDVFAGAARVIEPGGAFCFSVEASTSEDVALQRSLRYAHSRGYIEGLAAKYGFDITAMTEQPIREDQLLPIPGLYFWLERTPS